MGGNAGKSDQQLYREGCSFFSAGDFVHAVVRLLDLADRGHYGAQYCMGVMYHRGLGTEPSREDLELAREYLLLSSGQGCQEAKLYLEQYFHESADTDRLSAGAGEGQTRPAGGGEEQTQPAATGQPQPAEAGRLSGEGRSTGKELPETFFWSAQEYLDQGADIYDGGDQIQGAQYILQAARMGLREAQMLIGTLYEFGNGVERNPREAAFWYRRAAKRGHGEAQYRLGFLYMTGDGVPQDDEQAAEWLGKAAAQGDKWAEQTLRRMQSGDDGDWEDEDLDDEDWDDEEDQEDENQEDIRERGDGEWLPMEKPEPDRIYMRKSTAEFVEKKSQEEIIEFAHKSLSAGLDFLEKGDKRYWECISVSAELGCPEAQDMLGLLYARGVDGEKNLHLAREWTRRAIGNGRKTSRENLLEHMGPEGWMTGNEIYEIATGLLSDGDYEKGFPYMREAARMGNTDALIFMGLGMLEQEDPDVDLALSYLEKGAAEEPALQNYLGLLFMEGKRTEKNIPKCLYWSEKAADAGQTDSMVRLAILYTEGEDVKEDGERAVSLFRQAAQAGDAHAQRALGWLYLRGKYVEQDQRTARDWLQKAADQGDEPARELLERL